MHIGRARSGTAELLGQLAGVVLLIGQATRAVDAATQGNADVRVDEAKNCVTGSSAQLSTAARRALSGYRRLDGRTRPTYFAVQVITAAGTAAAVAYALRVVLDLPALVCAGGVLLSICGAAFGLLKLARWSEARTLPAHWPGPADPSAPADPDLSAALALIERARGGVTVVANGRLAAFATLGRNGPDVVWASKYDAVLTHLRIAEGQLCQGYDALERWHAEVNA